MQNIQNTQKNKDIELILHICIIHIPHNLQECHERQYSLCLLEDEVNCVINSPHCGFNVEFVKKPSYLIWQSFQYSVFPKLASIAMRNCLQLHCMVTQPEVVTIRLPPPDSEWT